MLLQPHFSLPFRSALKLKGCRLTGSLEVGVLSSGCYLAAEMELQSLLYFLRNMGIACIVGRVVVQCNSQASQLGAACAGFALSEPAFRLGRKPGKTRLCA